MGRARIENKYKYKHFCGILGIYWCNNMSLFTYINIYVRLVPFNVFNMWIAANKYVTREEDADAFAYY